MSGKKGHVRVVEGALVRRKGQRVRFTEDAPPVYPVVRRPALIARMLALAHHLQGAIDEGVVPDRAELARRLGLTRARVTHVLTLLLLAPDIQMEVLQLQAVDGVEPLSERALRMVAEAGPWSAQRAVWAARKVRRDVSRQTDSPAGGISP